MWKKIQTWLIVAVAVLIALMFGMDMCSTTVPETGEHFGIKFTDHAQFLVFTFVTFMLAVITFFHYDKRLMQVRLCLLESIMLFGYQVWILVEYFKIHSKYALYSISIASLFPVICIILLMISAKYILRDEANYAFDMAIEKHAKKSKKTR